MKRTTKRKMMQLISEFTMLHIGVRKSRKNGEEVYFVVLNSEPNVKFRVWVGVVAWALQLPLMLGVVFGFLAAPDVWNGMETIVAFFVWKVIAVGCGYSLYKLATLFELRPSWNTEDYIPTEQEIHEWNRWVHCKEEQKALKYWF